MILEEYNEAVKNFSEATEYDSTGFGVVGKLKDAQDKAKKSKRKDYYKILGVEKGASDADIRKAYKKAADVKRLNTEKYDIKIVLAGVSSSTKNIIHDCTISNSKELATLFNK